jgi:transposase
VQLIAQSTAKSDRRDAELLARLGRADVELLAPIEHRSESQQADLAVVRARDGLVQARTRLINIVRGIAKSFGVQLPKSDGYCFHRKVAEQVPAMLAPALAPLLQLLAHVEEQMDRYDETLEQMGEKYPDVAIVSQPCGVGIVTALTFLLTLSDKKRFRKSRMVGPYVGLRPKRDQSGDTDKQLPITKTGDAYLRRLLVGSANYILGPFGKDSDLRRWGLKLAERGGQNGRRRAKVAVARKLSVLMHRLWVTGEVYQPVGYRARVAA